MNFPNMGFNPYQVPLNGLGQQWNNIAAQLANLQNAFASGQQQAQQKFVPPAGDSLIRLNSEDSVENFAKQMSPNSRLPVFMEDADIFYVIQTDASNYPSIRKFSFTEIVEAEPVTPQYVTIEEFNKFKEDVLNGQQSIRSFTAAPGATGSDSATAASWYNESSNGGKADDVNGQRYGQQSGGY